MRGIIVTSPLLASYLHLVGSPCGFQAAPQVYTFMLPTVRPLEQVCVHSVQTGPLCDVCAFCRESWNSAIHCLEKAGQWETQPIWLLGRASLIRPTSQQSSSPQPGPPEARGSPSCTAASMAPGTVQKPVPRAPSHRTKGPIDWFEGAFPGVPYISLPRCGNEEAERSEEGRGRLASPGGISSSYQSGL